MELQRSRERMAYSINSVKKSWSFGGKTLRSLPQTTHIKTFWMNRDLKIIKYHKQLKNNIRQHCQNFAVEKSDRLDHRTI